jgi:hypothetical protein
MGVGLAEVLARMGREVDDHQPPAGAEHPCRLRDRIGRVFGIVQHLMEQDDPELGVGEGQCIHLAEAHQGLVEPGPLQGGAGDREHVAGAVNPDCASGLGAEEFEHPPGAGPDIEEVLAGNVAEHGAKLGLDVVFRDVEPANRRPAMGITREIGGCRLFAPLLDLAESGAVPLHNRIVVRDERRESRG